jgi:hypothetical protein
LRVNYEPFIISTVPVVLIFFELVRIRFYKLFVENSTLPQDLALLIVFEPLGVSWTVQRVQAALGYHIHVELRIHHLVVGIFKISIVVRRVNLSYLDVLRSIEAVCHAEAREDGLKKYLLQLGLITNRIDDASSGDVISDISITLPSHPCTGTK